MKPFEIAREALQDTGFAKSAAATVVATAIARGILAAKAQGTYDKFGTGYDMRTPQDIVQAVYQLAKNLPELPPAIVQRIVALAQRSFAF